MSDSTLPRTQDFDPKRSTWIPWVFVGGMALVVLVNLVLVYAALSTFTGVTTGKSYDRGRSYNQVLAEAARQDALGWAAAYRGAAAAQTPRAGAWSSRVRWWEDDPRGAAVRQLRQLQQELQAQSPLGRGRRGGTPL